MMRFRLLLAISLILVRATIATSHHSFAGVYDDSRLVTVSGVVTQFKFVNPHALMYMDITDPSGKVAKWTIEFAGRLNLSNLGWTADSIKSGEHVTVTGNPTHSGSDRIAFKRLAPYMGSDSIQPFIEYADTPRLAF